MKRLILLATAGFLTAACSNTEHSNLSSETSALKSREEIKVELATKPDADNVIWSAASLDNMLTLLGEGYDDAGKKSLASFLGKSHVDSVKNASLLLVERDGLVVKSANNFWTQPGLTLKPSYLEYLDTYFDGLRPGVLGEPMETATRINKWAADKTNNLITNVVSEDMITEDLAALMANALYFKGDWQEQFDPQLTEQVEFSAVSKSGKVTSREVATMRKFKSTIQIAEVDDNIIIRLPYKGDTHSMYIAFAKHAPIADSFGFMDEIIEVDPSKDIVAIYRAMIAEGKAFSASFHEEGFDYFNMPKFNIETTLEGIQDEMMAAGYSELFTPGSLANLSDDPRLYLAFILQKAKIIVNEEGSEAAAVTIGGISATSIRPSRHLLLNGPFVFSIYDEKNKVALFEGIVRNPN